MILCWFLGHKLQDKFNISKATDEVLEKFKTVVLSPRNNPTSEDKLTSGKYHYSINADDHIKLLELSREKEWLCSVCDRCGFTTHSVYSVKKDF